MPDDFEFEPDSNEPSASPTDRAKKEAEVFGSAPPKEDSVVVKLWSGGHLSFNPNSHAPIFAIVALFALLLCIITMTIIGLWVPEKAEWFERLSSALGYGVTGIIGAMVGSAAVSKEKDKSE